MSNSQALSPDSLESATAPVPALVCESLATSVPRSPSSLSSANTLADADSPSRDTSTLGLRPTLSRSQLDKSFQADQLQIAGLVPYSSVDWPGKLVATVFCQGCPWQCPYCHNFDLIPILRPGIVPWTQARDLLRRRQGLLDGVVFSGGEPTLQRSLTAGLSQVREMGFQTGLHTAGAYPYRLEKLLQAKLVDWVGLDIKALPQHYQAVAGRANAGERAWMALQAALCYQTQVDLEVRLTAYPQGPRDCVEVAAHCRRLGVRKFALQIARPTTAPNSFISDSPDWQSWHRQAAEQIADLGFVQFTYRH